MTAFVHWYPLQSADCVPEEPGVYQIRVRSGLLEYPTGKSAMVNYGAADNLRAAVAEQAERADAHVFLCRHKVVSDPEQSLNELTQRFAKRFGQIPSWQPS